jgi:hypothetical protein
MLPARPRCIVPDGPYLTPLGVGTDAPSYQMLNMSQHKRKYK